ncbi:glutamate-5-semialdehyde dehydrogenase [Gammaproteobacteria bacterium]|nr:glutamate-5-semialdehyde dehydrogenase [Gammaproteobacteria bacterium]
MVCKKMSMELSTSLQQIGLKAKSASAILNTASSDQKNIFFEFAIQVIEEDSDAILAANQLDIKAAQENNKDEAFIDRLALDTSRLQGICNTLAEIKLFDDPVGRVLASWDRPNGLNISRVATPLGVIGLIFESRPNVAADAGGLCLKSGNAVILRSGKDGLRSSSAIVHSLQKALKLSGLPKGCIQIVPSESREAAIMMLEGLNGSIDVIVPRGGKSLVAEVEKSAKVPVFGHLEGICHIYVDECADEQKALSVCINAKMRRTGICGAVETILIHENISKSFTPKLLAALADANCEIRCCKQTIDFDDRAIPASESDWSTEYLAPIISIKSVSNIEEAIEHIRKFGTGHTESIISEDKNMQSKFTNSIDSAIVMINTSTQFADGGEFGLGGEIGIATGKFHARGPVGIDQLTSFKYIVSGDGHIRD